MTINEKIEKITELDSELSFSVYTKGQWDFVKSTALKTAKCTTLEELGEWASEDAEERESIIDDLLYEAEEIENEGKDNEWDDADWDEDYDHEYDDYDYD